MFSGVTRFLFANLDKSFALNLNSESTQTLENEIAELSAQSKFEQALLKAEELLALYQASKDHKGYITVLNRMIRHNIFLSRFPAAHELVDRGMQIAVANFGKEQEQTLDVIDNKAYILLLEGKYRQSLSLYEKNLEIRKNQHPEESREVAKSLTHLGRYHLITGNFATQFHYCTKALGILEKQPEGVEHDIARIYNNLGIYYYNLGKYQESIKSYNKSKENWEKSAYDSEYWVTFYYSNVGLCLQTMGDLDEALSYHRHALTMRKNLFGHSHRDVSASHTNIGLILFGMDKEDEALESFLTALEIALEVYGEMHTTTARYYYNVATAYYELSEFELARTYYEKSIHVGENLHPVNRLDQAFKLAGMAKVHTELQDFDAAENLLRNALERVNKSQHSVTSTIYWQWGKLLNKQARNEEAIGKIQQAITQILPDYEGAAYYENPKIRDFGFPQDLILILRLKGKILFELFQDTGETERLDAAFQTYKLAVQLIDQLRKGQKSTRSRYFLAKIADPMYEECLEIAHEIYTKEPKSEHIIDTFKLAERGKSMNLLLMINETQAKITSSIPTSLLNKESELSDDLHFLEKKIQEEKAKGEEANLQTLESNEKEFFQTKLSYDKLIKDFERDFPEYYDLKYNLEELNTQELQGMMDHQTCLIEYFVGQRNIFVFLVSKTFMRYRMIPLPSDLAQHQAKLRESIDLLELDDFRQSAHQLYRYLIEPILIDINGKTKLIFICDDVINFIPFDALLMTKDEDLRSFNEQDYLIKKYTVSYHYSAHLYLNTLRKQAKSNKQEKNFLGIAPVRFGKQEEQELVMESTTLTGYETKVLRVDEAARDEQTLNTLPNTVAEVRRVYDLFEEKHLDATAFLYGSASKTNLIKYAKRYRYILIATHGFGDERDLKLSGIYLAKGKTREHDDNRLYISDAYRLALDANLVVLSSCSSGIGELLVGEGMIAINRGFLYSGAANIIFSLFDIPDNSTSELVQQLFERILEGSDYASSLRHAKLKILQRPEMSVQDWAGFALIGS